MSKLTIDLDEKFENFPHAPIVEAVIDIRASTSTMPAEDTLKAELSQRLEDYEFLDSMQNVRIQQHISIKSSGDAEPLVSEVTWKGLRFQSKDKKHIAQFNRDGFVFSRLQPYLSWEQLFEEGMRLWAVYAELTKPVEVGRIGLRYINRILLPEGEVLLEDYLKSSPQPPIGLELPFVGFLHQDTLAVPGYPYAVNIIKTLQEPAADHPQRSGLIVDIDSFTTDTCAPDELLLKKRLMEMRWVKNKVFFGSFAENAWKLFR